ncbi:MAG: hypothetical protein HGGPFJEG_01988 [Ignavibacteria bacterium]|nr:hypothetical protein [Ignavibacteria bacterium]
MKNILITLNLFIALVLQSCSRDELINPSPDNNTLNGAFVLCEGTFNAGSSKLSFYNSLTNSITENIFNPGTPGLFPSGMQLVQKELYMTEQGNFGSDGKIYLLDTNGTVRKSTTAGINPFSLAVTQSKIYITNGPSNNVSVLDKNTFNLLSTIPVGIYPQEILHYNGKIFVCNTRVFGGATDSTVSVIDVNTDQVIAIIKVMQTPSSLAISNEGYLYIGCPGPISSGKIFTVNLTHYTVIDTFTIGNGNAIGFDKDISVDPQSNYIYFISYYNNIVQFNTSSETSSVLIPNPNTTENYFYGYKFDSQNKLHYVTNAKNFQVSGKLEIYNNSGSLLSSHQTGIAPRRIEIKN